MIVTKQQHHHSSERRCRPVYSVRTLLGAVGLVAVCLAGCYWWSKESPLPINDRIIGHYRGIGFADGVGFLGKNYYAITFYPTEPADGETRIYLGTNELHRFAGTYANSRIRHEGKCLVEYDELGRPTPEFHRVISERCYTPDGKLGSEVKDGTGTQSYWTLQGQLVWRLDLEDGRRKSLETWNRDGAHRRSYRHVDGEEIRIDREEKSLSGREADTQEDEMGCGQWRDMRYKTPRNRDDSSNQ